MTAPSVGRVLASGPATNAEPKEHVTERAMGGTGSSLGVAMAVLFKH